LPAGLSHLWLFFENFAMSPPKRALRKEAIQLACSMTGTRKTLISGAAKKGDSMHVQSGRLGRQYGKKARKRAKMTPA